MNSSVGHKMQQKWDLVKDEAKEKFDQAKQAAEKGLDTAKDTVEKVFDSATDKVSDWWDSFTSPAQPQSAISSAVHTLEIQGMQEPLPQKSRMSLMAYLGMIFLMMVVLGGAYVGALQYLFEKSRVYCERERLRARDVPEIEVERYYKTL